MDSELEAMIAASSMDLAIKSFGSLTPTMDEWNAIIVPRAGVIRRWIRAHAFLDQAEVTGLDQVEPEFVPTGIPGVD